MTVPAVAVNVMFVVVQTPATWRVPVFPVGIRICEVPDVLAALIIVTWSVLVPPAGHCNVPVVLPLLPRVSVP